MNMKATLHKCQTCKRLILVERALVGTDHDASILAKCWSCVPQALRIKMKDENPQIAETLGKDD